MEDAQVQAAVRTTWRCPRPAAYWCFTLIGIFNSAPQEWSNSMGRGEELGTLCMPLLFPAVIRRQGCGAYSGVHAKSVTAPATELVAYCYFLSLVSMGLCAVSSLLWSLRSSRNKPSAKDRRMFYTLISPSGHGLT
eukprot:1159273-Pelagomonas_calceolata.AAC.9